MRTNQPGRVLDRHAHAPRGIAMVGFGMLAMHAPVYYTGHVFWLFCAGVWLLVCSIVVAVIRAISNRRGSA